jgi:hypothetical protein
MEGLGEVRRALDLMGIALTEHNHQWTDLERKSYERASAWITAHADPQEIEAERDAVRQRHRQM